MEKTNYVVLTVSKKDFELAGYDSKNITEEMLKKLADDMQNSFYEPFWDELNDFAVANKIPKLEE